MEKNFFSFGYLAILSGLFIVVSFLVYLTKGNNSKFLGQKLKLGALIIALTATLSCAPRQPMCYSQVAVTSNQFHLKSDREVAEKIIIETDKDKKINGEIKIRSGEEFSYIIYNWEKTKIQSGDIKPLDGKFDSLDEEFEIDVKEGLVSGNYTINFYKLPHKDLKSDTIPYKKVAFTALKENETDSFPVPKIEEAKIKARFQHLCYSPIMPMPGFTISKEDPSITSLEFKLKDSKIIHGEIRDVRGEDFSFRLEDKNNKVVQKGTIKPLDGKWDNKTEDYKLELDKNLKPGQYYIYLYEVSEKAQEKDISHFLKAVYIKII
ncbi:hypothetical protein KAU33_00670 [Candidatus Dependentiae bacterium]|nr:hypothetical protein [Candidatus Dependentiae bacterium]